MSLCDVHNLVCLQVDDECLKPNYGIKLGSHWISNITNAHVYACVVLYGYFAVGNTLCGVLCECTVTRMSITSVLVEGQQLSSICHRCSIQSNLPG